MTAYRIKFDFGKSADPQSVGIVCFLFAVNILYIFTYRTLYIKFILIEYVVQIPFPTDSQSGGGIPFDFF